MTRALPLLMAVILWPAPAAPVAPSAATGWASAYAPGAMEQVIALRSANGWWHYPPPVGWYQQVDGAIAEIPCTRVGAIITMRAGGDDYRVLVADCAGADGGAAWMTENRIAAELDWRLWQTLTAAHGRPLRIELR